MPREVEKIREGFVEAMRADWKKYLDSRMCFLNAVPKWICDSVIDQAAVEFEKENGFESG